MQITTNDFGRIEIADVPLPGHVRDPSATYTYSGKVFVLYRTDEDPYGEDWYHAAVVDDDGGNFSTIFSGRIPEHAKANGIRHMPFADNRRVLLGDYVLECSPDIDTCTAAELVPVEYPWGLEDDPTTTHHWSEIIVSPDNEHIAWTILRNDLGAAVGLGKLRRDDDRYVIEDQSIISTVDPLAPDPRREGYFLPAPMRGGEVKQFVRGGTAISSAGGIDGFLPDSVVQDLDSEEMVRITRTPGYDETTIFSPDERLGLVMTSRASKRTDAAILGLVPRPHAILSGMGLAWAVYTYTVSGVRSFREGNVGPVLIDIERSMQEPGYEGVPLNNPDESWVYCSPMSWHPSGRKAMWLEMLRGSEHPGSYREMRVRTAHLLDHQPSAPIPTQPTPSTAPYGISGAAAQHVLRAPSEPARSGRIAGAHSGHIDFERVAGDIAAGRAASSKTTYVDYSDDGRSFYNGYEQTRSSFTSDTVYRADLEVTGEQAGEMRLRATWSGRQEGTRLLFDPDTDGLPKSHGFARYGHVQLNIEDLVE
ncbi:hypothetical protein [Arthrobacter sp. M4]|uniref:hypothetical protein n=1 Tax=Arthrobacter sp. M4 TaxID=218160 RepID=UPI001CDB7DD2|nr:hypothetical protein [Arthrobacter sp. M4]MCA4131605.1 hypothetical protein [Arthrobacter sp. M4]